MNFSNPFQFDMAMLEPVHSMMMTGIRVDQAEKKRLQTEACELWDETQETLESVVGGKINVDSKKFVPQLLYDELGLPKKYKKNTKGQRKVTADEAALRTLMAECKDKVDTLKSDSAKERWMEGYIICRLILQIRGIRKQISSYLGLHIKAGKLAGFAPFEDPDGRIRGTISVGGTETARFSHSKTLWDTGINLATIPRKLRTMFIPDDGYEMAEFDLNRGESWIYAHLSKDPELLRIHHEGLDFHAETASAISTVFGEEVSVDWVIEYKNGKAYKIRYVGKRTNHATAYRMKKFKCAESINEEAEDTGITVTVGQAGKAQDIWHNKYFGVKDSWWVEIEHKLSKDRTLTTPYGRIHTFHGFWGEELFKTATAYVPQSTSVDYLNRGFLKVYHEYQKKGAWGLSVLAQTHDSILVQYKVEHRDEAIPAICKALTSTLVINGIEFSIPVEPNIGQSWGSMNEHKIT